jgi:CheY-like chemotaxis protein
VGSGTGLGLATVYGIAKQHGGDVWVYSETGVGTTFKVYFPLCLHGTQLQETTAPVAAAAEPSGSSVILVVEDEAGVRHLLREILRQEGHRVLAAAGAEEAWEMSRAFLGDIHLLITDVVLPRHGGREVAERLVSERPGLQVLFMSGYTEKTVVDHGVLGTEIDFLQKPFSFEDVLAKVRRALSAS